MVILNDNSHPTGVDNIKYKGLTIPLPQIAVQSKGQNACINKLPYGDKRPKTILGGVVIKILIYKK